MTLEIKYKCDLCGQVYTSKDAAMWCEESHVKPIKVVEKVYNYELKAKYPDFIEIEMSDGRVAVYKRR